MPTLTDADIDTLATETMRLQLAGIDSFASNKTHECMSVESPSVIDEIAEKVIEKLKGSLMGNNGGDDGGKQETASANFVGNQWRGYERRGKRGNVPNKSYQPRAGNQRYNRRAQKGRKCRTCKSPEHFFRECPLRFCQACGNKGHDAWDSSCPKYQ